MPPEWRRRMGWSTVYQELGLLQPVCTCRGDNWVTVWLELAISLASAPAGGWWEGRHEASPVQQHEAVRFIARTRKQQWVTCPVSVGCDSVRCLSPSWEDLLLGKGLGLLISALPLHEIQSPPCDASGILRTTQLSCVYKPRREITLLLSVYFLQFS